MIKHIVFISMIVCVHSNNEADGRIVNTLQGPVKGYKQPGWDLFEFNGIPYATAPTGRDRFKAPLDPPTWSELFEAVEKNIMCPQNNNGIRLEDPDVRENCLVTTIYVPDTNKADLPVVVFVHGGAFQNGFADGSSPRNFVQSKDVIIAMFNYRLGPHGFLCLGTESAPGNAGMKDQVAFLRWIQKNIAYFGGNPDDVTIYGNSAGGRAVDLLTLSKMADGLFNRMIADSGVSLGADTVQIDPLRNAKTYAKMLNFDNVDDLNALEEFYLNISYDLLTSVQTTRLISFLFSPCVERDLGQEVLLHESPYETLKKGGYRKIPLLYGFTEFDGTFRIPVFDDWKDDINENLRDYLPHDLQFLNEEEKYKVVEEVRAYYFGDQEVNDQNILLFIDYFTDTMYVYPMIRAVKLHLEAGHEEVYLYEYSFTSPESTKMPYIHLPVASHSAQTNVILDFGDESSISKEFKIMKTLMREMWYNVITAGQPVLEESKFPAWPASQLENLYLMSLNQTIELKPLYHRSLFWEHIYEKYYKVPVAPSA